MLMLVLAEWPAASQKLKGKIVDRAGEAVAYATVYIDELKLGTTSNARGYYELRMPLELTMYFTRALDMSRLLKSSLSAKKMLKKMPSCPNRYMKYLRSGSHNRTKTLPFQ